MSTLFIHNVMLDGVRTNIRILGNRFSEISEELTPSQGEEIIEADGFAIVPPFYNGHTHAAMNLLRGYADDMELFTWLNDHIWPLEAKLTPEDIYAGSRLAVLEMIKSGTVFFNDMYDFMPETFRATEELGIRAMLGVPFMDWMGEEGISARLKAVEEYQGKSTRVGVTVAPHAPYTVSEPLWIRCAEEARKLGTPLHFHLSETAKEVSDCVAAHGLSPVRWLDKMGVLGPNCVAAHVVHVDEEEMEILKERGVAVVHNPVSNMKLSSGYFKTKPMLDKGLKVLIGTDGCSSNNNLDMQEEAKFAAMMAKCNYGPETFPVKQVLHSCTLEGAKVFGVDGGEIAVGKLADALLINLNNERFVPNHSFESNWVYASTCEAIDTMICDGKVIMRHRKVKDEEEIIAQAKERCKLLLSRKGK